MSINCRINRGLFKAYFSLWGHYRHKYIYLITIKIKRFKSLMLYNDVVVEIVVEKMIGEMVIILTCSFTDIRHCFTCSSNAAIASDDIFLDDVCLQINKMFWDFKRFCCVVDLNKLWKYPKRLLANTLPNCIKISLLRMYGRSIYTGNWVYISLLPYPPVKQMFWLCCVLELWSLYMCTCGVAKQTGGNDELGAISIKNMIRRRGGRGRSLNDGASCQ